MCGVIHQQLPKHPPCHDTHQPHLLIIFWPSVKSWLLLLLICWNIFQPPLQLRFQSQPSPDDGTGWRWTWPPSLRAAANSAHALFLTTPQPQRPSCTGFPEYFLSWIFWTCITFQRFFLDILKSFKLHQLPEYFKDTPVSFFYFLNIWKLPLYSWNNPQLLTQVLPSQPLIFRPLIFQELNFSLIGRSWTWHYPSSKLGIQDGGGLKQISLAMFRIIKWDNNSMKCPMHDKASYHTQQHPQ